MSSFLSLVHNIDDDAGVDADADAIPALASASTSKNAACIEAVSLMLTLS